MILDNIFELRKKYSELPDYKEETIKIRIVKPFIEMLGYKEDWHRYEYPVIKNKKITDITIMKNNKIEMVIEVKKGGNYSIKSEDIQQLLTYLMTKNVEWGIVTNGKIYILINYKINGEMNDKEVLKFNLLDITNENICAYFTFESIFETKITTYFKHLAQFKYYKLQDKNNYHSWSIYNSTILNYFNFIISKYNSYRKLEYLNREDFKEFINYNINESKARVKNIRSKKTVLNKYRHITKLYELFVQHNELNNNPFRFMIEEEMVSGIEGINLESDDFLENINLEMLETFINLYKNKRDSERNTLIFLLCLYAGLGRDDIRHIKIDGFDYKNNTLRVKGIELPLPKNFINRLKYYIENIRNQNAKVEYLFDSNYGNYAGEPLSKETINTIISRNNSDFNKTFPSDNHIKIKPEVIRKLLVRKFFEEGFSIEEIVTITGMELHRIAEYITTEEIKDRTIIKKLPNKHPFLALFENS